MISSVSNQNQNSNQMQKSITTSSSSSSSYIEVENQFILRMPMIKSADGTKKPHPATLALREALSQVKTNDETNVDPLKDRLFIELNPDTRKGRIKFDNEIFEARLVDLPCIIESLKTTDKKMFYKSADICQMLVCRTKDDPPFSNSEDEAKEKEKKLKKSSNQIDNFNNHLRKYQWPHGIAPPLKNVRRKRFRKVAKKKTIDYAEIEQDVKKLFRADREAVKVEYEVCYVEADLDDDNDESKIVEKNEYDSDFDENMDKDKSITEGFKSKSMIEESNMSTEDVNDDTSSMPARKQTKVKTTDQDDTSNLNPSTTINFDDVSNDASNLDGNNKNKNRTNFKNLFVKDVLGDLSSSEEENDEDEDDAEDDEEEEDDFDKRSKASSKPKIKTVSSGLFGEDSISNFDDPKNTDTNAQNEFENEESYSNIESTINKSKFNDTNEIGMGDDEEDEETDNELTKKVNMETDDTSSNMLSKKSNYDDGSMMSPAQNENDKKAEMNAKLNKLMDELQRIQEERKEEKSK